MKSKANNYFQINKNKKIMKTSPPVKGVLPRVFFLCSDIF